MPLVSRLAAAAERAGVPTDGYEVQMLYGIQPREQQRLAGAGHRVRVLISYGGDWFPWYVRRLAERPANVWFVVRSMVKR
jgi:proline dehydrogenase